LFCKLKNIPSLFELFGCYRMRGYIALALIAVAFKQSESRLTIFNNVAELAEPKEESIVTERELEQTNARGSTLGNNKCSFTTSDCKDFRGKEGKSYFVGDFFCSPNSEFQLGLTTDTESDLCICRDSDYFWCAGIENMSDQAYMVKQKGGNFMVFDPKYKKDPKGIIWMSGSSNYWSSELLLSNDGQATITNKNNGRVVWLTPEPETSSIGGNKCGFNALECVDILAENGKDYMMGDFVCSPNSLYQLGITSGPNADLCMCDDSDYVWCAGIENLSGKSYMRKQQGGNFIVFDPTYKKDPQRIVWKSETPNNWSSTLKIRNNGEAVIQKKNGKVVWSTASQKPPSSPSKTSPETPPSPSPPVTPPSSSAQGFLTEPSFTSKGYYHDGDVCEKKKDGICPCYPKDDDWYCENDDYYWYDWLPEDEQPESDTKYEKCNTSKFPTCNENQKLCPMRKPRLDRFFDGNVKDMYYYIDYDCIQCIPKKENCSKCSPGIWCPGIGRCVTEGLAKWCRNKFGEEGIGR